jgi:hypothetical protein
MALVQHQFADQQVQLRALGQLALQYLTAGMTSGLTGAQAAMAQAAISGGVQGAVSGNFDLGKILQDVAFAGVSGAATAGFDLNDTLKLGNDSLLGMVNGKLSFANIANSLGDSVITAGLTTAVYGGTFGDNFQRSFTNSVVMTGLADVQKAIGDFAKANGIAEGSTQHVILHMLAGCFGAAAAGGDCAAGAAAGMAQSIYAGTLGGTALSDEAQQRNTQLLGGIAAAFASGGDTSATMLASNIALSGMANNRQLHREEAEWIRNNAADLARELGVSVETAKAMLTGELLRRVSDDFSNIAPNERVARFIDANAPQSLVVDGQNLFAELARDSKEYRNSAINISNLRDYAALYQSFTPKVMGLQDNRTEDYFGQNVDWLYYLAAKDGIGRLPDWQGATEDFSTLAVEFNRALGAAGINDARAYELWSTISGATAITTSAGGSREMMIERMAQFSDEELGALVLGRGEMVMNLVEAFTGSQATKFAMKQALAEVGKKYRLAALEKATITRNRDTHTKALARADAEFKAGGIGSVAEVSLQSCTGTVCRADRILTLPTGSTQTSIDIPKGFTATQLVNGVEIPIQQIPVSGSQTKVVIEMKTGDATLSKNQSIGYNEIPLGTVTGVGENAKEAKLTGPVPSDLPVVILRPN